MYKFHARSKVPGLELRAEMSKNCDPKSQHGKTMPKIQGKNRGKYRIMRRAAHYDGGSSTGKASRLRRTTCKIRAEIIELSFAFLVICASKHRLDSTDMACFNIHHIQEATIRFLDADVLPVRVPVPFAALRGTYGNEERRNTISLADADFDENCQTFPTFPDSLNILIILGTPGW